MDDSGKWFGAKEASGAYQAIIAAMPPHDTYIETHLGGGTVLRKKPPAPRSIGIDRDPAAIARNRGCGRIELHCGDCVAYLEQFDFAGAGRVLIYADPPYVLATRTSKKRYRFDYTDADHARLIRVLKSLPAAVMLSGYPSRFYDELLPDWRTIEFQAMTRGGVRTEKVWCNFPSGALHWAAFAGKDFKKRQDIKRKAQRWANKYRQLPEAERVAVLAAMLEAR